MKPQKNIVNKITSKKLRNPDSIGRMNNNQRSAEFSECGDEIQPSMLLGRVFYDWNGDSKIREPNVLEFNSNDSSQVPSALSNQRKETIENTESNLDTKSKFKGSKLQQINELKIASASKNVQKTQSCPVKTQEGVLNQTLDVSGTEEVSCKYFQIQTPTKKKYYDEEGVDEDVQDEKEVMESDSENEIQASESSNSENEDKQQKNNSDSEFRNSENSLSDDDENKLANLELQKIQEKEAMIQFAMKNGFDIEFKEEKAKSKLNFDEQGNLILTAEQYQEMLEKQRERMIKSLDVPPALEIITRKFVNKEPVRTGFNEGLIPVEIKNNFEKVRTAQGPQIQITSVSALQRRQADRESSINSREASNRKRALSREGTRLGLDLDKSQVRSSITKTVDSLKNLNLSASKDLQKHSVRFNEDTTIIGDDQQKVVEQIVQLAQNNETSLRHLFYLEFKKNFAEGEKNPIIYSRFGKKFYGSDEKFDPDNFNQLIRTCNLKKIIKAQQEAQKLVQNARDKKFKEPISYPMTSYYTPKGLQDRTLVFESRFESGNLQLVSKVSETEYDLVLQNDINSKGHTQWFYFRTSNTKRGQKVKFNMLNMIKNKSLYNEGMKVLIYSEQKQNNDSQKNEKQNSGWIRGGEELGYFQNNYKREISSQGTPQIIGAQRTFYTFTFTHTFEYDNDNVYFAYSVPYTYTELTNYLCDIQSRQLKYVSRNTLCRTLAGNKCEYLTITNRVPFDIDKKKEGVVLTSRIHPGESNSSWMMKGVIDFLISSDPQANELRNKYVFKIVPMLNPDGVINGNYRCSLAGCDLNRRWKYPSEILHPTVYHCKKLILRLAEDRPLALYCDLHGHSRRKNMFIYGNTLAENPESSRIFPFLLSKIAQPHFSYDYSKFSIWKQKEQTSRVAVWKELQSNVPNIFTLEASFCGPKPVKYEPHRGNKKVPTLNELNYHFSSNDLMEMGKNICQALTLYRIEKDAGFTDIESQIEQYHLDLEAKIEQENLIRQQNQLIEQRKLNLQKQNEEQQVDLIDQAKSNKKSVSLNLTGKKTKPNQEQDASQSQQKQGKVNYNKKYKLSESDSDAASDSAPSEDNLDDDQILKLIPKSLAKKKFLKGKLEEKKKKIEKTVEKPKPKTVLMPCLSQKKEKLEKEKKDAKEALEKSTQKKAVPSISKTSAIKQRSGIMVRDVGTQINYQGDGKNLSLMEIDIINHTGCKWSKIIYPGFKGYLKPLDKQEQIQGPSSGQQQSDFPIDKLDSTVQMFLRMKSQQNSDSFCQNNFTNTISPKNIARNIKDFSSDFQKVVEDVEGESVGLRSKKCSVAEVFTSPKTQNESSQVQQDVFYKGLPGRKESMPVNRLPGVDLLPLTQNQFACGDLSKKPYMSSSINAQSNQTASQVMPLRNQYLTNLEQKIRDSSFNEPRSLISGSQPYSLAGSATNNGLLQQQCSQKKKSMIRLCAFEYSTGGFNHDLKKPNGVRLFDMLEAVHESGANRQTINSQNTIESVGYSGSQRSDSMSRNNSYQKQQQNLTNKQVSNQGIATSLADSYDVQKQNCLKKQNNTMIKGSHQIHHLMLSGDKTQFTNVAQQILRSSDSNKMGQIITTSTQRQTNTSVNINAYYDKRQENLIQSSFFQMPYMNQKSGNLLSSITEAAKGIRIGSNSRLKSMSEGMNNVVSQNISVERKTVAQKQLQLMNSAPSKK